MKTGEDFRREFPEMDDGFKSAACTALSLLTDDGKPHGRRQAALLVAVLCVLLATVAAAAGVARWRAQEFINSNMYANLTPEAEGVLSDNTIGVPLKTPWAQLTLRQAVYDGMAVYLLFEGVPTQDGWMLAVGAVYPGGDQAFSHGSGYPTDMSIGEYAAQQGYAGIQLLEIFADETTGSFFDSATNADGSFSLMVWAFVRPEYRNQPELTLNLRVNDANEDRQYTADENRCPVTLPLAGDVSTRAWMGETAIPEMGIIVNGVTVHRTAMTSYLLFDYHVADPSGYDRSMFYSQRVTIAGEDGEALPKGTHPLSLVVESPRQRMGEGTYYITNRQLPENENTIILQTDEGRYAFPLQ